MSFQAVCSYLEALGLRERVLEFPASSATVALAAEAIGTEPCRIAKSIAFWVGESPVLLVTSGDARIDNAKFRARFGCRANMLRPEETLARVGHAIGGVCPFAILPDVRVYLDTSLRRFESVYPACGSGNSAICLSLEELERAAQNVQAWADLSRLPVTE